MAANQRQKSGSRSSSGGGRSRSTKSRQAAEGMRAVGDQASRYLQQGSNQVRELTRDHEGTAVLIALAAGFGVGLVLGSVVASASSRPKSWRERAAEGYGKQLEGYGRQLESYGRQLIDRIEKIVPEAIAGRLEALKPR